MCVCVYGYKYTCMTCMYVWTVDLKVTLPFESKSFRCTLGFRGQLNVWLRMQSSLVVCLDLALNLLACVCVRMCVCMRCACVASDLCVCVCACACINTRAWHICTRVCMSSVVADWSKLSMHAFLHVCKYVCIYVCLHVFSHARISIYMYGCMCECMQCLYVMFVCIYLCIYVCFHVCMCVYMYGCMYNCM